MLVIKIIKELQHLSFSNRRKRWKMGPF